MKKTKLKVKRFGYAKLISAVALFFIALFFFVPQTKAFGLGSLGGIASHYLSGGALETFNDVSGYYDQYTQIKNDIKNVQNVDSLAGVIGNYSKELGADNVKAFQGYYQDLQTAKKAKDGNWQALENLAQKTGAVDQADIDKARKALQSTKDSAQKAANVDCSKAPATDVCQALKKSATETITAADNALTACPANGAKASTKNSLLASAKGLLGTPAYAQGLFQDCRRAIAAAQTTMGIMPTIPDTPANICETLFASDETNIFKELTCSMIRVVSLTVGDLASNTTCTILGVGNSGNYDSKISFSPTSGNCLGTESNSTINNPFGTKDRSNPNLNTGIYKNPSQLTTDLSDPGVTSAFNLSRGLVAILAFIALMIFAFANIVHYEVNTYAIKKALPVLLIAPIGGAVSLGIVGVLSRGTDFLYHLEIFDPIETVVPDPMTNIFSKIATFNSTATSPSTATNTVLTSSINLVFIVGKNLTSSTTPYTFVNGIFGTILLVIPSIVVIILQYVLALRPFAVEFLAVVAPFAFAALILPQTQFIFRKWWTYLFIALLYAPVVNIVFYFLKLIGTFGTGTAGPVGFIAVWAFKLFAIILLIRFPFAVVGDTRKIASAVAKSHLGETLGLAKLFGNVGKTGLVGGKIESANLSSNAVNLKPTGLGGAAQRLIAAVSPQKRLDRQIAAAPKFNRLSANQLVIANAVLPNLNEIAATADKANMARSSGIITKSVADLHPETFRAVVDRSDLKLWRDTRLIEQLKNKNGQILDNEGAALRIDAVRKSLRLAQAMEKGRLANPEALKLVAQKGALDNLPLPVIREAISEKVLTKEDFRPTYKNDTEKMFERFQILESKALESQAGVLRNNNTEQIKKLMSQDRKDYSTGYKDLQSMAAKSSSQLVGAPQMATEIAKNIISNLKNTDGRAFEKNGEYFLSRLSEQEGQAQNAISQTMQKNGVAPPTAEALAANPQIDFAQAVRYMKEGGSAEAVGLLKNSFANRDISNTLTSEVSKVVSEEKVSSSTGITKKIAENFKKDDSLNLGQIENSMRQLTQTLSRPLAPQQAQEAIEKVNKFYPAPILNTTGKFSGDDIRKAGENAGSIVSTVSDLIKANVSRETIKNEPFKAQEAVTEAINNRVRKATTGQYKAEEPVRAIPSAPTTSAPSAGTVKTQAKTIENIFGKDLKNIGQKPEGKTKAPIPFGPEVPPKEPKIEDETAPSAEPLGKQTEGEQKTAALGEVASNKAFETKLESTAAKAPKTNLADEKDGSAVKSKPAETDKNENIVDTAMKDLAKGNKI